MLSKSINDSGTSRFDNFFKDKIANKKCSEIKHKIMIISYKLTMKLY